MANEIDMNVLPEGLRDQELWLRSQPYRNAMGQAETVQDTYLKHLRKTGLLFARALAGTIGALERIRSGETEIPGLRPEFRGHDAAIADKTLKQIEVMENE